MKTFLCLLFGCLLLTNYLSSAFVYQQCPFEKICVDGGYISQVCLHEDSEAELQVWSNHSQFFNATLSMAAIKQKIGEDCPQFRKMDGKRILIDYKFARYELVEADLDEDERQLLKMNFESLSIQNKLLTDLKAIHAKRTLLFSSE